MTKRIPLALAVLGAVVTAVSCGGDDDRIPLAGNTQAASGEGEALYRIAKASDDAGKRSKAIKQYGRVADKYPFAPSAAMARYREAELLEQEGDIVESFEAYQKFLQRYQGSGLYSKALSKQAEMAQSAADGKVKAGFSGLRIIGIKGSLSTDKAVEMLGQVRDNAPRSETSAKAQFTIGELYQAEREAKKSKLAIEAYRKLVRDQPDSKYSAEALFRVGVVLLAEADRGNRNQATLDLADEAFRDYLMQYPGHAKNAEARRLMGSLKSKDLARSLEIAEFYDKSGQTESAKIYYREVLKNSASGSAHEKAKARLKALGE
ncbi:tetratricopeptide repeat protein [Akkermansiaceae bacterium]|nr:tetratricopeptide repeat protein [Akkermansiaceae bacterium]